MSTVCHHTVKPRDVKRRSSGRIFYPTLTLMIDTYILSAYHIHIDTLTSEVLAVKEATFMNMNGFSNLYFGRGSENDEYK